MLLVFAALFFTIAMMLGFAGVDYFLRPKQHAESARLQARIRALQPRADVSMTITRDTDFSANPYVHFVLEHLPGMARFRDQLMYADWNIRVDRLLLLMLLLGLSAWAISTLAGLGIVLSVAAVLVSVPAPLLYMQYRIRRRVRQFTLQFPDALTMMVSSLRAGHGLQAAMQLVAEQMEAPVGVEFAKIAAEMEVGVSFRAAMRNLSRRVDSHELKLFVTAILIQTEVGGNIVQMLLSIDQTIRERIRILGQVQVLTAQGRLTGVFLGLMPIFLAVFIMIRSPEYLGGFLSDPRGQQIMAIATALWILGFFSIRRITNIRV